ncbi:hypothetical protein [Brucella anthropi]|nr:hypothetical protein [Brucella anthropi]
MAIDGKRLRGSRYETGPGLDILAAFSTTLQATIGSFIVPPDNAGRWKH